MEFKEEGEGQRGEKRRLAGESEKQKGSHKGGGARTGVHAAVAAPVPEGAGPPPPGMCSWRALAHAATAFTLHPGNSIFFFVLALITA